MIYCKNETKENEKDEFICSRCKSIYTGFERVQIEDGEKEYCETELKYCPSCGAKVIIDEQENIKNSLFFRNEGYLMLTPKKDYDFLQPDLSFSFALLPRYNG